MAAKKSKALAAAEKAAGPRKEAGPAADGRWTRAMVERAILAFNDIERIPPYDDDGIRSLVRDFLRFVDKMELGWIEEDAMPLARAFVERGYAWLAENPRYAPFRTRIWNVEMVEHLIIWFNDITAGPADKKRLFEVAEKLHTFELVVKNGAVEPGEAEALADAFLEYGHRWLERQPDALAHYQALA